MKKFFTLFFVVSFALTGFSQALIQFEKKAHDFGKIYEIDGKITYEFVFKNAGNLPLVINRVQTSCGCTSPKWTKTPIEPGKSGSIIATYNPAGRKGVFSTTITVVSNATENQERLVLRGDIIPKANERDFIELIGTLQLKTKEVQMNNVEKGINQLRTIAVKNSGDSDLHLSFGNVPDYLTVSAAPETLLPGREGTVSVTFNSSMYKQWGEVTNEIYLLLNNAKTYSDENKIRVTSNIVENFDGLTINQKRNAPILELNTRTVDFGTVKPNTKYSNKFSVKNIGVNTLEIRHIVNTNKKISVKPDKLSVGRGKKADVKIELDTNNMPVGYYKNSITLQTNDPQNSFVAVELIWQIK